LARPAGESDVIAGVAPRYVATPGSTDEAAEVMRIAAAHDLAVVARGAGTKQHWGLPPRRLDLVVDTGRLTGIVEHAAGDLVVVVRAGTPLAELAEKVAPAGQQLALDPMPGATVGGTVAVNTSGPRRMQYGTARDLLIGITVVRADGKVAHSGGKVVKNVAGYDLGKLITGSYGTLGLITRCAFRLHPLPAETAYVTRRVDTVVEAGARATAVRRSQVVAAGIELDAPPGGDVEVAVLLEGTPEGVSDRAAAAADLLDGDVGATAPPWWGTYPWGPGDIGLKLTAPLSQVAALTTAARAAAEPYAVPLHVRGSAGVGVLYAGLPGDTDPVAVTALVEQLREVAEHVVVLTAPAAVRERLDVWGPVDGLDLMRRVKAQFDPGSRLAPGRFVGGI
jgi:glycolate oxidase FAD binding subunit